MTDRRKFLTQATLAAGALTLFRPFLSLAGAPRQIDTFANTIRLLHTADLNGQSLSLASSFRGLGGASALQAALQNINAGASPDVLVHVGNVADAARQSRDECLALYRALRRSGYDAVVPGESDLAKGRAYFQAIATEAGLPLIDNAGAGMLPGRVLRKGRFVIGLINASAVHNSASSFRSAIVNKTAASLKQQGCNVVVCLTHKMSIANKHSLAKASVNVDVIMGCAEKLSVHNAEIVCNQQGAEVVLSRACAQGVTVSCVDLTFDADGKRNGFAARNHFVGAESESLSALMRRYRLTYA